VNRLEESGEKITADLRELAEEAGIERVETAVVEDVSRRTILDYADAEDVDLAVMGTHGRTGLDR
jgi:nucleotide-binding universal stress UspA family protein